MGKKLRLFQRGQLLRENRKFVSPIQISLINSQLQQVVSTNIHSLTNKSSYARIIYKESILRI